MYDRIKVGITLGDPSGIGSAITRKAIPKIKALADFTVIGDRWVYDQVQSSKFSRKSGIPQIAGKVHRPRSHYELSTFS